MVAVPFNRQGDVTDVAVWGDTAHIDLWYPKIEGRPKFIKVGLVDTRAADGVRLHYDFERDGFVVEQPKPHLVCKGDYYEDIDEWIEVGFFRSWRFNDRENGPSLEEFEEADRLSFLAAPR